MSQEHAAYWQLVERLMHYGWYREGQDLRHDPSGRSWRFREGHTTDSRASSELRVMASSELGAMRILADQLRQEEAAVRKRRSAQPALAVSR
jgi:hypothetical protein